MSDFGTFEVSTSSEMADMSPISANKRFHWSYVAVPGIFGFIALAAWSGSSKSLSNSQVSSSKVELVRIGQMRYSELTDDDLTVMFADFKVKYNKKYNSDAEEEKRFGHFKTFVTAVDERNTAEVGNGGQSVHGITKFADLSATEFTERAKGYKKADQLKGSYTTLTDEHYAAKTASSPTSGTINWAGVLTTAMKDQGYCGSCWAFAAASQLESDAIRAGYLTTTNTLSEQQLVSCDKYSYGCDGGSTESAYYYIYEAGGLLSSSVYPYSSYNDVSGECSLPSQQFSVTLDNYYLLKKESTMKAHVVSTGPLAVCLDADNWSSYTGGVLSSCGNNIDHCVQIVGINLDESYWIVRNSWGSDWGEDGYIYLKYGEDTCAITTDPTYVSPVKVSK